MGCRVNAQENADIVLDPRAVCRTPSGKLCRYMPPSGGNPWETQATFVYVESAHDSALRWGVGFSLTRRNWHLLQPVQAGHA